METKTNFSTFKCCFVPLCSNSSITTPNKIFIHVPTEYKQRKLWFTAAKRKQKPNILKSTEYCCEDHFDLKNDMLNWVKFQLMPNTPKIMKKGVVPHKFDCQIQVPSAYKSQTKLISIAPAPKRPKLDVNNLVPPSPFKFSMKKQTNSFSHFYKNPDLKDIKSTTLETTLNLIRKQPQFYIGIPEHSFFIVNIISKKLNLEEKNILLCLEKIKRDIGMVALANDFNTTKQTANQYFVALVPLIAQEIKKFIYWPSGEKIVQNLPRYFRGKYCKVQSIINCLEVNIPEPSTSFRKSIYWSETKKSYTYKYLVSCTPDGIINFVSGSYGGKISDSLLLEVCGFLDVIPTGSHVLGGVSFKNAEDLLTEKGCVLRSSISNSVCDSSKSGRDAALRSHMTDVLNCFKLFQFLHPYSHVEANYLYILDNVMLIVAGLINLRNCK